MLFLMPVQLKEVRLKGLIETHDLERKLKKVYEYLERGDKCKVWRSHDCSPV